MNEREELAGIVAGLRRTLARAGSDGDLIAGAAARHSAPVEEPPSIRPIAEAELVVSRLEAETPGAAGLLARAPMADDALEPARAKAAFEPAGAAAAIEHARATAAFVSPAARPPVDLFGPPKPSFVFKAPSAPAVPPAEALHSIDPSARAQIDARSLPVLEQVASEVCACTKCGLATTRTRGVPGTGSARSGIVFVGEAPGADEDRQGQPFVGRAGELLTKIIQAMDDAALLPGVPITRDTVYICNVLKSRPPENRNPLPHEVEACSPYLIRQLEALEPRVICCLGKFAAELLIGIKGTIAGMRGKTYRWRGAKLIVTYHPAACLRNANLKRPVWEDMQLLAREYLAD